MAHGGNRVESMSTPQDHDPALARFRRGASRPAGPAGPPPVAPPPVFSQPPVFRPGAEGPITVESLPSVPGPRDPGIPQPLFGELLEDPRRVDGEIEPLFEAPEGDQYDEFDEFGERDPGKTSGIVSIVVGAFVGIVGVFIAISSLRRSREVGLSGLFGFVGILVSIASLIVAGSIGISYIRYETQLAQQCALVGPGQYLTSSGDQVSCP
jgi:hypothetical protein